MYAVIQIGSSQFKVSEGDQISPCRMPVKQGDTVNIEKVLAYAKGADVRIGQPYLKDVKVTAEVRRQEQADKVIAFKYRKRKDSFKKKAQRQKHTVLDITKISAA